MFDLESNQNNSPTVGEFLRGADDADTFITYVVGDNRDDERVSIEGIITTSKKVAALFLGSYPDEFGHCELEPPFRLWWD
jgi:hypothetical protein